MKNFIASILILSVLMVSCKKENQTHNNQSGNSNIPKYAVTFTVAQFSQSVSTIGTHNTSKTRLLNRVVQDTSTLAKQLLEYYYVVYDKAGNEIRRMLRSPGAEATYHNGPNYNDGGTPGLRVIQPTDPFNVITDSLAAGTYTIVVCGTSSDNLIELNYSDGNFSDQNPEYSLLPQAIVYASEGLDQWPRSTDLFFSKNTIIVGNQNITANFTLNREVAQLEVDLQDAIPANVAYIKVGRQGEYNGFSLANEVPVGSTEFVDDSGEINDDAINYIVATDIGTKNYMMYRYIWNTVLPINIVLEAHDKTSKIVFTKTINNVQFYTNRKTILTGKLFDTTATVKFNISTNQAWGPNGPTIQF